MKGGLVGDRDVASCAADASGPTSMKGGLVGDRDRARILAPATCGNTGSREASPSVPLFVISILAECWSTHASRCGNGSRRLMRGGRVTGGFAGGHITRSGHRGL